MGSVRNAGHGALRVVLPRLLSASVAVACALTLAVGTALAAEPVHHVGDVREDGYVWTEFTHVEKEPVKQVRSVFGRYHEACGEVFGYLPKDFDRYPGEDLAWHKPTAEEIDWDWLESEKVRYEEHKKAAEEAVKAGKPLPCAPDQDGLGVFGSLDWAVEVTLGYQDKTVVDFECWATPSGRHDPECTDPTHTGHDTDPDPSDQRPSKPIGEVRDDGYVLTEFAHYEEVRLMGTGTVRTACCLKDQAGFGYSYYGFATPRDDLDIDWEFVEYENQRYAGHGEVNASAMNKEKTLYSIPNPHCQAYLAQGFWTIHERKADRILGYETRRVVDFTCWATPDGRHDPNCTDPTHDDSHVDMVLKDFGHNVKTHYVTVEMPWTDEDGYYLVGNSAAIGYSNVGVNKELRLRAVYPPDWVVDNESAQKWMDQMNKTRRPRISELDTNRTHIDFRCWATLDGTHDPNCTDPSHVIVAEEQAPTRVNANVARNGLDGLRRAGEDLEPYFSMLDREGFDTSKLREGYAPPVKVYRLYNTRTGEHLYTTSSHERDVLAAGGVWIYESVGWNAPTTGTPVYRVYNSRIDDHLYTDEHEATTLAAQDDWTMDNDGKPLFYSGGDVELYRLYHYASERHLITRDPNEYKTLPSKGWLQEGVKMHAAS